MSAARHRPVRRSPIWLAAALLGVAAGRAGADIRVEAEEAVLVEAVRSSALTGYSGSGYVSNMVPDRARVTFSLEAAEGIYDLYLGYGAPQFKRAAITVDGRSFDADLPATRDQAEDDTSLPEGNVFREVFAARVPLQEGTNTVVIGRGWGYYELDYIRLALSPPPPVAPAPANLCDPQATDSARRLLERLGGWYGHKTLSGQYGLQEYRKVQEITGVYPAVLGEDLIKYSPSRVEHGEDPAGSSERWIEWVRETGAILTLCWHWNAPAGLVNTEKTPWWFGFYTRGTSFDVATALADPEGDDYRLLLRDIDAIAAELKKFQDADIPVLWRPLHEASGGWFWWGAKGPEPFKTLWRLLHDRLVEYHGLHNLIWVYTHDRDGWYPGDDVVDLIGFDEYEPAGAYWSAEWRRGLEQFGGRKMLSVSECGAPPDPDLMALTGTHWLTFLVWKDGFLEKIPKDYLKQVYRHPDVLTLDDIR